VAGIRAQTVKPAKIWAFANDPSPELAAALAAAGLDRVVTSSENTYFHARLALAMTAATEYVAVFDDDTIPGANWLANCLETMARTPGILGTAGVVLGEAGYGRRTMHGWQRPCDATVEVDLVGQAWFLRTTWIHYLFAAPAVTGTNGEDIELAARAFRMAGIRSFCPPHPAGGAFVELSCLEPAPRKRGVGQKCELSIGASKVCVEELQEAGEAEQTSQHRERREAHHGVPFIRFTDSVGNAQLNGSVPAADATPTNKVNFALYGTAQVGPDLRSHGGIEDGLVRARVEQTVTQTRSHGASDAHRQERPRYDGRAAQSRDRAPHGARRVSDDHDSARSSGMNQPLQATSSGTAMRLTRSSAGS
jgi:hypothetical protein